MPGSPVHFPEYVNHYVQEGKTADGLEALKQDENALREIVNRVKPFVYGAVGYRRNHLETLHSLLDHIIQVERENPPLYVEVPSARVWT